MKVTYQTVRAYRTHTAPCPTCGQKTRRQRQFQQTINPSHPAIQAHPDEDPYMVVFNSVQDEADAWVPDHRHQGACQTGGAA